MTTYGSSTLQAFTEALQTNLQARLTTAGETQVTVWDGPPSPSGWGKPDWIMLGDIDGEQEGAALASSTQPRDERYTLAVLISVARPTRSDQRTVSRRAFVLLDYLNQEIRGNVRQGVTGVLGALVQGPVRQAKRADAKTRECALEVGVYVHARI